MIAETGFVTIGGIPQWVEIHGADAANPVLVALHGGPGMPETPLLRHFNGALERAFTVVYWEQRGAGRSYGKTIPPESMTIGRFVADLDELVEHVKGRLGKEKVVLLGHSWGSALGTLYAARHPEKVAAYVGTGQIGDLSASELASYHFVLSESLKRGKTRAVRALEALGPPPYDEKQLMVQRRWLGRLVGMLGTVPMNRALRIILFAPGTSLLHLPNMFRGMMFSLKSLWTELNALNLEVAVPELKMPVWFLLGRNDHQVDAQVAAAYFEKLSAPKKTLAWFEKSGHFPLFEEPDAFNAVVTDVAKAVA